MPDKKPPDRRPNLGSEVNALDAAGDAAWLDAVLDALAPADASPHLEQRILSAFDALAARRRTSLTAHMRVLALRLRDAVWPGAPLWQPVTALALSLMIGIGVGQFVPVKAQENTDSGASLSLDAPPSLGLAEGL